MILRNQYSARIKYPLKRTLPQCSVIYLFALNVFVYIDISIKDLKLN